MDRERFAQLIAAYGADPAHWPADERAEAEALANHADVAGALALEARLDELLGAFETDSPSFALHQRILQAAPKAPVGGAWWRPATMWLSGASLAAACAVGVIAGVSLGGLLTDQTSADKDSAAASAFGTATAFDSPIDVEQKG